MPDTFVAERAVAVNGAGRARPTRAAALASVSSALPERVVPNAAIAAPLGIDDEWIASRTGIRERRAVAEGETLVDLAARAGDAALGRAGVGGAEVDLVLVATFTPDDLQPHAAPLVAERLGAARAGAVDIGAACTGFLSAIALASAQIESRRADSVLVIGAEVLSGIVDYGDRATAGLFGDGAGAALVTSAGGGAIGPVVLRSDGTGAELVTATHAERKLRMDGRATFRAAVAAMSDVTREVAAVAGVGLADIDLFVYHQANRRIVGAVGERLGLPTERVVDCIERYGNTSAASIPIALCEAAADRRLVPGTTVLLGAFGAGFTWGGAVIEWEGAA